MKKQDKNGSVEMTDELNEELQESLNLDNNSKPKKSKKGLMIFLALVIVAGVAIYNPFKDRTVADEAIEAYEEASNQNISETFNELFGFTNEQLRKWDPDSLPGGSTPGGMVVTDYGPNGSMGVLKETYTAAGEYLSEYDVKFRTYYMKNKNYADEKYNAAARSYKNTSTFEVSDEKIINDNESVFVGVFKNGVLDIVVKKGTVVFVASGSLHNETNLQSWFDSYLKVNYTVPSEAYNYMFDIDSFPVDESGTVTFSD